MEDNIVSMREMQRNYKRILEKAKARKEPVFLGSHGKAQAVVMAIEDYRKLEGESRATQQKHSWKEARALFDRLANEGKQSVSLADFVRYDRQSR